MNFPGQGFQKLQHYRQTDRHTDRRDRKPLTTPHLQMVINAVLFHFVHQGGCSTVSSVKFERASFKELLKLKYFLTAE